MKFRISVLLILVTITFACKEKKEENYKNPEHNSVSSTEKNPFEKGKKIYTNKCAQCHLANGKGIPKIYPPLANSNWLTEKREESIHAVKYGLNGEITVNGKPFENVMFSLDLSDKEVAEVMNYVMNSWGNKQQKPVTEEEVSAIQK
ncbi:c-type cytochrome [Mesonia maritima]|uniref:Mono/diheme cytochrome c family protein n=1 Tax=Mesonia maritima TaxID=1793873 RepID=A0ABU1K7A1_9FLAO|nr:cytochrome c [Mesonia maritima]MDR6300897.1 mono/diheme cytochrome c family protein [Mesonia maritima]